MNISARSATDVNVITTCDGEPDATVASIPSPGNYHEEFEASADGLSCTYVQTGTLQGDIVSGAWSVLCSDGIQIAGTWSMLRLTTTGIAAPGFSLPQGIIPPASATVLVSGDILNQSVSVDLKIENIFAQSFASSLVTQGPYNVYVAALVPNERIGLPAGGGTWFVKTQPGPWEPLSYPMKAFIHGVAVASQDQRVRVEILRELNLFNLIGTEIYIGYGTSGDEMIQNQRYRGVFDVQP